MSHPPAAPADQDPNRSPSYPQRTHIRERGALQQLLAGWDSRIAEAQTTAKVSGDAASLLFGQMAGARDQIAEVVKRMPMEVGDMYEEDQHRLGEAVAALERLMTKV